MSRSCTSPSPWRLHGGSGTALLQRKVYIEAYIHVLREIAARDPQCLAWSKAHAQLCLVKNTGNIVRRIENFE
jgi:hypothetical protein